MKKKVLFVGADPDAGNGPGIGLDIDAELEVVRAVYTRSFFEFLTPLIGASFMEFTVQVEACNPSVIHLAAHGDGPTVHFPPADLPAEVTYKVDVEQLHNALTAAPSLELLYLDACRSTSITSQLPKYGAGYHAVGFDGDIEVQHSTRGAGIFHTHIANGLGVAAATANARRHLQRMFVNCALPHHTPPRLDTPDVIRPAATIVAKFYKNDARPDESSRFAINFGLELRGSLAPDDDYLMCFFSQEDRFIEREYVTLLSSRLPHDRIFWHRDPALECWDFDKNATIYCTYGVPAVLMDTVQSRVVDALRRGRELGCSSSVSDADFRAAIDMLCRHR